jgi:curved DNA-binding protein
MSKDYYKILGLNRRASQDDIRKAFKKLARQYHPDVNQGNKGAEEKFKNISEAYDVLSDPKKKKAYDQFGSANFNGFPGGGGYSRSYSYNPFEQQGGGQGFNFDFGDLGDIFGDIFGSSGAPRGRQRGFRQDFGRQRPTPTKGRDMSFKVDLEFLDAIKGCEKAIRLSNGVTFKVKIPSGVKEGSRIRLAGKGEPGIQGGEAGDLYIEPQIKPHPYFRREGQDVELTLPLTILEAIEGTKLSLPTIDGRVDLKIPAGVQSGQKLRLKGRGVIDTKTKKRGDQYVVIQIKIPPKIDSGTKKALIELFQGKTGNPRDNLW